MRLLDAVHLYRCESCELYRQAGADQAHHKYSTSASNIANLPDCQWTDDTGDLASWYLYSWPVALSGYDPHKTSDRLCVSRYLAALRRGEEVAVPHRRPNRFQRVRLAPWAGRHS